jgi:hypothetical protein
MYQRYRKPVYLAQTKPNASNLEAIRRLVLRCGSGIVCISS